MARVPTVSFAAAAGSFVGCHEDSATLSDKHSGIWRQQALLTAARALHNEFFAICHPLYSLPRTEREGSAGSHAHSH